MTYNSDSENDYETMPSTFNLNKELSVMRDLSDSFFSQDMSFVFIGSQLKNWQKTNKVILNVGWRSTLTK